MKTMKVILWANLFFQKPVGNIIAQHHAFNALHLDAMFAMYINFLFALIKNYFDFLKLTNSIKSEVYMLLSYNDGVWKNFHEIKLNQLTLQLTQRSPFTNKLFFYIKKKSFQYKIFCLMAKKKLSSVSSGEKKRKQFYLILEHEIFAL